jgi:hypothetical protein
VVSGAGAEFGFDFEQAVVLGDAFAAAGGAAFDLSAAHGDGEVGGEGVFGVGNAICDDEAPADVAAELNGLDRFCDGAYLSQADDGGVGCALCNAFGDVLAVGGLEIVADDLDLPAV